MNEEILNDFVVNYLAEHPWIIVIFILVTILKGLALWQSAGRKQKIWFLALLIVNSLGLLEAFYLLYTRFMDKKNSKLLSDDHITI